MKKTLKRLFTKNIIWKILSLVAAGIFWLAVVNIIDPTIKRTFENIPVEILNESALTSANQVYEVVDGDVVDVTITSKRSLVERLSAKDFTATADLAELSAVNAARIQVKLNKNTRNTPYELDWNNAVLRVKLEKRVTQKYRVQVSETGELGEGYVLGTVKAKPNIIEVSGGESKMRKIDHVGVSIELDGQTEEFTTKAKPVAYDSDGMMVDASNLTFSATNVKVSVGVRQTMDVPIEIKTTGIPAEGYHLIQTDRQPESVRVSASDPSLLNENLKITLEVNIEGAKSDVEKEIDITSYLGPEYMIEDNVTVVSVRCEIGKSGSRTFQLTSTDIEVLNLPENHSIEFTNPNKRYEVSVTGSDAALKDIDLTDLKASIDIGSLGVGTHSIAITFKPPDGVRVTGNVLVEVTISKLDKETDEETPTPAPTAEPEETEEPEE